MKTILHDEHCLLGARMIDFAGWTMPLQYSSIIQEHLTVRASVGLFDVSHMGIITIQGKESEAFLDFLSTNIIRNKANFTSIYTPLCQENGGCIDDVIIFKENSTHFFLVANASNKNKDFEHIKKYANKYNLNIEHKFDTHGILALQGPETFKILNELFQINFFPPFTFIQLIVNSLPIIISHTGYTGELGVEIFAPNEIIPSLWKDILEVGKKFNISPIGLGARDTLRLEMGYALYSHELDESFSPIESVSKWAVKLKKENFLGKDSLLSIENSLDKKFAYGILLKENAIPRSKYPVYLKNKQIGKVTSGSYAPSLKKSIGLILVDQPLNINDEVLIEIRDRQWPSLVSSLPFYSKPKEQYEIF